MNHNEDIVKKIEEANDKLKDDYKKLKEVMNLLPGSIFIRDYDGNIIFANQKYAKEYNESLKELLNKNLLTDFKKFDQSKLKKLVELDREVIDKQKIMHRIEVETDLIGNEKILNIVRKPLGDNKVLGVIFDITKTDIKGRKINELISETELLHEQLDELINFASSIHKLNPDDTNKFWSKLLATAIRLVPKSDYGSSYINENGVIKYIATVGHNKRALNKLEINSKYFKDPERKSQVDIKTIINDSLKGLDFYDSFKKAVKPMKELMSYHVYIDEKMVGGISLDIKKGSNKSFSEDDKKILETFFSMTDYFYKSKEYFLIKDEFIKEVAVTLTKLLEFRDKYTEGHSQYVASLSKLIAEKMGLPRGLTERTYWAGLLHDIGKISIPDKILNKPGKLTAQEYNVIKKHPIWSYESISDSVQLKDIAKPILYHHERWDGRGYPEGLEGNDIPLISQIIGVADSWNAMVSKRLYRDALSKKEALQVIKENRGTQFSPKVADKFIQIVENKELKKIETMEYDELLINAKKDENINVRNAYFEQFLEHSEEAIVILDDNFSFLKVNKYFEDMFGYKQSEIQGLKIKDTIIPQDKLDETQRFIELLKKGETVNNQTYREKKGGAIIEVSLQAFPIILKDGNVCYYVIYNDITELKDIKDKYKKTHEKYKALFHNNKFIMLIIEPEDGHIIDANSAAVNFYGWTKKELISMKISDINMLSQKEAKKKIESVKNNKKVYSYLQHRIANGMIKDVEIYSQSIKFGGKEYMYAIIHDITDKN